MVTVLLTIHSQYFQLIVSYSVTLSLNMTETDSVPDFSTYNQRLESFSNWKNHITDKFTLAKAGFYYTNNNDKVVCFSCKGGLNNWQINDDPFIEHGFWFPHCEYIKKMIGTVILGEINTLREEHISLGSARKKLYEMYNEFNNKHLVCEICQTNKINIVILPCRHAKFCSECVLLRSVKKCNDCNTEILMYINIKL